MLRFKLPHHVYRSTVLEGKRYRGKEALADHLVDAIADGEEGTFELAKQLALKLAPKAKAGVYFGMIKEDMYPEVTSLLLYGRPKL